MRSCLSVANLVAFDVWFKHNSCKKFMLRFALYIFKRERKKTRKKKKKKANSKGGGGKNQKEAE